MAIGRTEQSLTESKRALELDPLSPSPTNLHLGWHYLYARQYDQAIEQLRKTLKMDPNLVLAHSFLAQGYEQKAMYQEAVAEFQKIRSLSGGDPATTAALGEAFALSGIRGYWQKSLELENERSKRQYVSPASMAFIYARLGEKDLALEWLQKACEEPSLQVIHLKVEPVFDSLRPDPRFQALLRRMGLPP